jgi:hypothetical protein
LFVQYFPNINTDEGGQDESPWAMITTKSLVDGGDSGGGQKLGVNSFASTDFQLFCGDVAVGGGGGGSGGGDVPSGGSIGITEDTTNNDGNSNNGSNNGNGGNNGNGNGGGSNNGNGNGVGNDGNGNSGGRQMYVEEVKDWCKEEDIDGTSVTMTSKFDAYGERRFTIAYCIAAVTTTVETCTNYNGDREATATTCEDRTVYELDPGSMKFSVMLDSWPKGRDSDLVLSVSVDIKGSGDGSETNAATATDEGRDMDDLKGNRKKIAFGNAIQGEFGESFSHGSVVTTVGSNGKTLDLTFVFDKENAQGNDTDYIRIVYDPTIGGTIGGTETTSADGDSGIASNPTSGGAETTNADDESGIISNSPQISGSTGYGPSACGVAATAVLILLWW